MGRLWMCVWVAALVGLAAGAGADPFKYELGVDPAMGLNLPNWAPGGPGAEAWEDAVQDMYDAGFRHVTVVTYRFVDPDTGIISSASSHGLAAPSDNAQILAALEKAGDLGMYVSLKPFLYTDNDSGIAHVWRGYLDFADPAKKATFFDEYEFYAAEMAGLAADAGADRFVIGTELKALTINPANDAAWRDVINAARAEFDGTVGYAANHDEYAQVTFWDALDEIGVDSYFELASVAESEGLGNPSVDLMVPAWEDQLDVLRQFSEDKGKPMTISEWGCVPYDTTAYEPWEWQPTDVYDAGEQLNCYLAVVQATDLEADWLKGVNFWHWAMDGNEDSNYAITADSEAGRGLSKYLLSAPEPAALFLVAAGLVLLAGRRR